VNESTALDVSVVAGTTIGDARAAVALFDEIWGASTIHTEVVRAVVYGGGYLGLAHRGGRLVGASYGFLGVLDGELYLHSHITGVRFEHRDARIGLTLKQHQRAWCAERGIAAIRWSYDPLVARNAHFNLTTLGARVERYEEDFYGPMDDHLNRGDPSDRLIVRWLTSPTPTAVPAPIVAERVPVPEDIVSLRRHDRGAAREHRYRVRAALGSRLQAGWKVVGFDRSSCSYLLVEPAERATSSPAEARSLHS
jgi:predicted GNAT superfamily acetyltransferase